MKETAIVDLPGHLDDVLTAVRGGEEVRLTEGGKAIARVVPVTTPTSEGPFPAFLTPPKRRLDVKRFLSQPRPQDPEGKVLAAFLRDREEGW